MNKSTGFVVLALLVVAVLGTIGCKSCPVCGMMGKSKPQAEACIDTQALKTLIDARTPVVILDARTGQYDDGRRIPGAKSLSPEATPEQVAAVVKAQDALIVTYCANLKCPASHMLAEHLKSLGYKNILEYRKGIEGWAAAGHPVDNMK